MPKGDPHWTILKFTRPPVPKCANTNCARPLIKGDRVFYYPTTRSMFCDGEPCGKKAAADFNANNFDEEQNNRYERGY